MLVCLKKLFAFLLVSLSFLACLLAPSSSHSSFSSRSLACRLLPLPLAAWVLALGHWRDGVLHEMRISVLLHLLFLFFPSPPSLPPSSSFSFPFSSFSSSLFLLLLVFLAALLLPGLHPTLCCICVCVCVVLLGSGVNRIGCMFAGALATICLFFCGQRQTYSPCPSPRSQNKFQLMRPLTQTEAKTQTHKHRHTNAHTQMRRKQQTDRPEEKNTYRPIGGRTQTDRDRQTETDKQRQTGRHAGRQADRQTTTNTANTRTQRHAFEDMLTNRSARSPKARTRNNKAATRQKAQAHPQFPRRQAGIGRQRQEGRGRQRQANMQTETNKQANKHTHTQSVKRSMGQSVNQTSKLEDQTIPHAQLFAHV